MNKDLFISGSIVVTRDENKRVKFIQFLPDDEFTPVLEQSSCVMLPSTMSPTSPVFAAIRC